MILNQLKYNVGNAARVLRAKSGFIVNNKIIQFCGLQRSGNHAVINWIIGQEFSKTCFINGVFPGANPWLKNWGVSYPNYPYWPKDRDVRGAFVSKDIVICSYENREIEKISRDSDLLPKYFGNSRESYSLIILRDPYNTFASWFQKNRINKRSLHRISQSFNITSREKIYQIATFSLFPVPCSLKSNGIFATNKIGLLYLLTCLFTLERNFYYSSF